MDESLRAELEAIYLGATNLNYEAAHRDFDATLFELAALCKYFTKDDGIRSLKTDCDAITREFQLSVKEKSNLVREIANIQ